MKELTAFYQAADNPGALGRRITRRKILGTLCSYAPEELIHAAGYHPMRLFPSGSDNHLTRNHLQAYCCSLARGVLADSLDGTLDFLYGTVLVHTCDTMQRLSDIWRLQGRYRFFADVILPVRFDTRSAQNYLMSVLERFKADLEADTGTPVTPEALAASIRVYNRIRTSLSGIQTLNTRYPGIVKNTDMAALVKGAMIMDRETAAGLLEKLARQLASAVTALQTSGTVINKRIFLSGSACDMTGLHDLFQQIGAVVAGDDLCTGRRWFDTLTREDQAPMTAVARRYMHRSTCPAKHRGLFSRAELLIEQVRQSQADGVVFVLLKFCDPHAFDYPYLKAHLDGAGIRSLLLELDGTRDITGQTATRLETFLHML